MRYLAWVDGNIVEASTLRFDEPYVMQRIHTLDYQAYYLPHHLELMREASEMLFGFASLCTAADAEDIIRHLLEKSRVTLSFSCPVVMRINSRGELSFVVETPTFGAGAYLRAKRYEVVALVCEPPATIVQTSVSVANDSMSDMRVRMYGGELALWIDDKHNLISRPWRPIFVVYRNRVYTPQSYESVEYMRCVEAVRAAGLELVVRDLPESSLDAVEEIFVVDIMGVSSISRIGHHRLLSSVASRIADCMMPKK